MTPTVHPQGPHLNQHRTGIHIPTAGVRIFNSTSEIFGLGERALNTKELRAVEQALLYWGERWRETKVLMHIDNRAVVYGLENLTMRGR